MNAHEQAEAARKLQVALDAVGLEVVRPVKSGGNTVDYEPVDAVTLIGAWLRSGWAIRDVPANVDPYIRRVP